MIKVWCWRGNEVWRTIMSQNSHCTHHSPEFIVNWREIEGTAVNSGRPRALTQSAAQKPPHHRHDEFAYSTREVLQNMFYSLLLDIFKGSPPTTWAHHFLVLTVLPLGIISHPHLSIIMNLISAMYANQSLITADG